MLPPAGLHRQSLWPGHGVTSPYFEYFEYFECCVLQELQIQAEFGHGMWHPIIVSRPFILPTNDYETLLQSHKEGLYVVGNSPDEQEQEEGQEEQQGAAAGVLYAGPEDWVMIAQLPGSLGVGGSRVAASGSVPAAVGAGISAVAPAAALVGPAHAQSQQQQGLGLGHAQMVQQQDQQQQQLEQPQQVQQRPFGLVAYVHYQQLLSMAGGVVSVPQSVTLAVAPQLRHWRELPGVLLGSDPAGSTALRLQLDFHRLKTR